MPHNKFQKLFLFIGGVLIFALFAVSSWEAWEEKGRMIPAVQYSNDRQEKSSAELGEVPGTQTPCSPPPMWAERCLVINGHALFIAAGDIADTDVKRSQGLSGRASMPENAGMLFVFDAPAQYSFWMHGMHFGLDFLWIREGEIVEITQNVLPPASGETPQTITPQMPVDMVLEVNAGWIEKNGIQAGMRIAGL